MNETKNKAASFLDKEMTRKEFLGFMGMAFLGVIGVGSVLTLLNKGNSSSGSDLSFGAGSYGGVIKQ
ncbi:MAG: hypothetical protein WCP00_00665 [bacterium]|jgi:hypothetical protein